MIVHRAHIRARDEDLARLFPSETLPVALKTNGLWYPDTRKHSYYQMVCVVYLTTGELDPVVGELVLASPLGRIDRTRINHQVFFLRELVSRFLDIEEVLMPDHDEPSIGIKDLGCFDLIDKPIQRVVDQDYADDVVI